MEPVLKGTVALVTGASSGIGAATATALAAQGAAVAVAARRRDRLEALAVGINGRGGTVLVLECDITDQRQAAGAVERAAAELGRLDTLINNAGVMLLGPVTGAPLPEWQQMVELNVLGLLYCAGLILPVPTRRQGKTHSRRSHQHDAAPLPQLQNCPIRAPHIPGSARARTRAERRECALASGG